MVRTTTGPPPSASPWSELEALYNISFESTLFEAARGSDTGDADNGRRERDRASLLPLLNHVYSRDWDDASLIRRYQGVHESPPQPDNTAGLSWSDDGRIL